MIDQLWMNWAAAAILQSKVELQLCACNQKEEECTTTSIVAFEQCKREPPSVMNTGTIYNCKLTIIIKLAHIQEHDIKLLSLKILNITCSFWKTTVLLL